MKMAGQIARLPWIGGGAECGGGAARRCDEATRAHGAVELRGGDDQRAVFVVALFHQFALVEVAASILTGLQVFFLSSAIGDLLDEKKESNRARNSVVALMTVFLVGFYSFTRYFR